MKPRLPKNKRCDYCRSAPVVWYSYRFRFVRMGTPRFGTIFVAACAQHEGCVSWNSGLAIHKPELHRLDAGRAALKEGVCHEVCLEQEARRCSEKCFKKEEEK